MVSQFWRLEVEVGGVGMVFSESFLLVLSSPCVFKPSSLRMSGS